MGRALHDNTERKKQGNSYHRGYGTCVCVGGVEGRRCVTLSWAWHPSEPDIRSLCDIGAMGKEEQRGRKPRRFVGMVGRTEGQAQRHRPLPGEPRGSEWATGHGFRGREGSGSSVPALLCGGATSLQKEVGTHRGLIPPPSQGQRLPAHRASQHRGGDGTSRPLREGGPLLQSCLAGRGLRASQSPSACSGLGGGMGTSGTEWERIWFGGQRITCLNPKSAIGCCVTLGKSMTWFRWSTHLEHGISMTLLAWCVWTAVLGPEVVFGQGTGMLLSRV